MNFELGKRYIVDVTEKGITPLMEFDENKWCNKDCDDLDFLTDEEKAAIINDVLSRIRAEMERHRRKTQGIDPYDLVGDCLEIIDEYKTGMDSKQTTEKALDKEAI